jgi:1-acyl-sn-glycerol-3-phosphate acyltransferase
MSLTSKYSRWLARLYRWLWLGRVASPTPEVPPGSLVFAAHYNGAIDGFTYASQLPDCLAVVSVQWHRHLIGRWLVPGIAIKRGKDRAAGVNNREAFHLMITRLREGGRLLYFPEGTSRLGPERLPVRRGTLLLLDQLRTTGTKAAVFFAAAHYHEPTRWRSAVSLAWVGPAPLPPAADQDETWVRDQLLQAQAAAYAMPTPAPRRWTWLAALVALPFLPIWAATSWFARRVADEENVIALWKFLFGIPITFIVLAAYTFLLARLGLPWGIPLASLTGGWLLWMR